MVITTEQYNQHALHKQQMTLICKLLVSYCWCKTPQETLEIKAGQFNEEGGSIIASFRTRMVAASSPASGLDNKEGSGKEEVNCMFQSSSPLGCFTRRSPCAGMQQERDHWCWERWGLHRARRRGLLQPGLVPLPHPGSKAGQAATSFKQVQITGQVHGDDTGPKSRQGVNTWVRVEDKRTHGCDQAEDQQALKLKWGSSPLGRAWGKPVWATETSISPRALDKMWLKRTALKLQTYTKESQREFCHGLQ